MATNRSLDIHGSHSITSTKPFAKSPVSLSYRVTNTVLVSSALLMLLAASSTCNNHCIPFRIQASWSFPLINTRSRIMGCKLWPFLQRSHRLVELQKQHQFPKKLTYSGITLHPLNVRKKHDQNECYDSDDNQLIKPSKANTNNNNKIKKYNKSNLPSKVCCVCKRPFEWRKKWAKVWDEVKYCSERCRRSSSQGN